MAIQLNDRDHLIFRLISEHQVLLEKHIAWFIAGEDKPVLIRDRLRKLFYLDYLLCQRHNSKLPWWTTPTKPLVYMLSPMSKSFSDASDDSPDLFDSEIQRHFLEVANIRMVCLVAKRDGEIEDLNWTTCKLNGRDADGLDAIVTLTTKAGVRKIGIINHPGSKKVNRANLETSIAREGVDIIGIVSRDEKHQEILRNQLCQLDNGFDFRKVLMVTHHNLYKSGITKASWTSSQGETIDLIDGSTRSTCKAIPWGSELSQVQAASA